MQAHFIKDLQYCATLQRATQGLIPAYRVMDDSGQIVGREPTLPQATCVQLYSEMVQMSVLDNVLFDAQRQGRISFYMTCTGEEATHFGSAAALKPTDEVFSQYREAGVLLHRGFTLDQFMAQCYGSADDEGKGRQMPVHYGCKALHFQPVSSPLATQIPQASGAAFGMKLEKSGRVAICYFGEGAASEGDFHAGLNMAATLECPVIFFCRNNGYAISTPVREQYRGDGIAARGAGYGMATFRVDGNDVFAVYEATVEARRICAETNSPVLIEALTYRLGHHSTSDDSSAYREKEEPILHEQRSCIKRFAMFLKKKGWWSDAQDESLRKEAREKVLKAFLRGEKSKKPSIETLFTDVYDTMPWNLIEQRKELKALIEKYPNEFDLSSHKQTE